MVGLGDGEASWPSIAAGGQGRAHGQQSVWATSYSSVNPLGKLLEARGLITTQGGPPAAAAKFAPTKAAVWRPRWACGQDLQISSATMTPFSPHTPATPRLDDFAVSYIRKGNTPVADSCVL